MIFPIKIDRTRIKYGIDPQSLHEIGIGFRVIIVSPDKRRMGSGQHRVHIPVIDTVVNGRNSVGTGDKLLIGSLGTAFVFIKKAHKLYSFPGDRPAFPGTAREY